MYVVSAILPRDRDAKSGEHAPTKKVSFPQNLWLCTLKIKRFAEMNKIADDSIHKRGNFIDFIDSR